MAEEEQKQKTQVTQAFAGLAATTPSLMGSAIRPAEPLGSVNKRKEGQSSIARRRANSSMADIAVGLPQESRLAQKAAALQQTQQRTHLVGANQQFDATIRKLIDDKYNKEYKLDRQTRAKAIEILTDYYNKNLEEANGTQLEEKEDLVMHATVRAAIFIASKCRVFHTDDGQEIRGCGLSTSAFLWGKPQIQIEEFQKKIEAVRLEANIDMAAIQDCVKVQNKIGINMNFYEKFSKLWEGLGIRDRNEKSQSVAQSMKKLTWLIFLMGKFKILNNEDITEMAYLLFACLFHAVKFCPKDVHCDLLDRIKQNEDFVKISDVDSRMAKVEEKIIEHLEQALKAQESHEQTECMIGLVHDLLLKLKQKGRLRNFSNIEDEINNTIMMQRHQVTTYDGICKEATDLEGDEDKAMNDFCKLRPSKCLHGLYDADYLDRNIRQFDQYYGQQNSLNTDFDERYFINHNGLQHTPIKLKSPLYNFQMNKSSLHTKSSLIAEHKSPFKSGALASFTAANQQAQKRARPDVELKFVAPEDIIEPSDITTNWTGSTMTQPKSIQRQLQFQQGLAEQQLREQLNQSQSFPPQAYQSPARGYPPTAFGLVPPTSQQIHPAQMNTPGNPQQHQLQSVGHSLPPCHQVLQTPIGQMMQLKHWIDDLQSQLILDEATGFITGLDKFLKFPPTGSSAGEEQKTEFYTDFGIQFRVKIQNHFLTSKILRKLQQKRSMVLIPEHETEIDTQQDKKLMEPIYRIFCTLLEKALHKELKRLLMKNQEMPEIIKNDTLQKSFLIYACVIHFYSKNINDLSVQEMLTELELPAYELWKMYSTFQKLDPNMPRQLREHFTDIERSLTLHLIWQKDTMVVKQIQEIIARNNRDEEEAVAANEIITPGARQNPETGAKPAGTVFEAKTFAQVHEERQVEEKALNYLKLFFNRVKQISAQTIQEMCEHLKISEECREFIWNILLVTLGLKSNLLFGRHLDQLIMCAIYGVCKINQGNKSIQVLRTPRAEGSANNIKFQDIIDAYKEIHKHRLQKSGRWQVNLSQSNSVSWVYIEVPLNPEHENPKKIDIIKFYNDVYLDKLKFHILKTKTLTLEQGSKTPVLSQSNFDALLTPGGRVQRPVINHFTKLTPLIDSLQQNKRFNGQTLQIINNAGIVATPGIGFSGKCPVPLLTPRTGALYAANERSFMTSSNLTMRNPAQVAQNYANVPVHMLATAQANANAQIKPAFAPYSELGQQKLQSSAVSNLCQFVNLSQGAPGFGKDKSSTPAQPTFNMASATNLERVKAPPPINERPEMEESDAAVTDNIQKPQRPQSAVSAQASAPPKSGDEAIKRLLGHPGSNNVSSSK